MNLIQTNKIANHFFNNDQVIFTKHEYFLQTVERIKNLKHNVILICGNSDYTFTDSFLSYVPQNVKYIFAQNTTCDHDNVIPLPIGVENEVECLQEGHGIVNESIFEKLKYLKENPFDDAKLFSLANFTIHNSGDSIVKAYPNYRHQVQKYCLMNNDITNDYTRVPMEVFFQKVIQHQSIISPIGNGLECIRTYETLYMNRVPIIIDGINLLSVYKKKLYNRLPIVFLDKFDDLLNTKYIQTEIDNVRVKNKEILDIFYWIDLIESLAKKIK